MQTTRHHIQFANLFGSLQNLSKSQNLWFFSWNLFEFCELFWSEWRIVPNSIQKVFLKKRFIEIQKNRQILMNILNLPISLNFYEPQKNQILNLMCTPRRWNQCQFDVNLNLTSCSYETINSFRRSDEFAWNFISLWKNKRKWRILLIYWSPWP